MNISLILDELGFSSYEIENLSLNPLLVQTGYLTIKDYDRETMEIQLFFYPLI